MKSVTSFMESLMKESKLLIKQDSAEAIILGCAGMTDFTKKIEKQLKISVIDGVTAAVKMAEGLVSLKKQTSKVNTYRWPSEK